MRVAVTSGAIILAALACKSPGPTTDSTSSSSTTTSSSSSSSGSTADAGPPIRTDVSFTTADGLVLGGYVVRPAVSAALAPGVVLVHQYGANDEQWGDLPTQLAEQGWVILAFNLRGHGDSAPYGGAALADILTDPDGAPRDVTAALIHLRGTAGVDGQRLAVVGTSIGANLAVVASGNGEAKTYAAFSTRRPPVDALSGGTAQGMRSVLYVAGALDPGGQAVDSQAMYDETAEPREIFVQPATSDHGMALLQTPENRQRLVQWLARTLP